MSQAWMVLPVVAGFVLVVDLVTAYLRKRAWHASQSPEPRLPEKEQKGEQDEGFTTDRD